MSLDSTDLLLVQDTSTNTLHKVTFANLSSDVKGAINYDSRYVNITGDNITGDITLGPNGSPNITFQASTGDAAFSGRLTSDKVQANDGLYGDTSLSIYGGASSTNSVDISSSGDLSVGSDILLTQAGDITVGSNIELDQTGAVTALSFVGDGSALTNLPISDYISNGTVAGQILVWSGTEWVPQLNSALDDGTEAGQLLQWDGSDWNASSLIDAGTY